MSEELQQYVTFTVTDKEGKEVCMAVMDEFDFENKHYVVSALVEGDTINEDGMYIYRANIDGDDFTVSKITNKIDYEKVVKAYMEME